MRKLRNIVRYDDIEDDELWRGETSRLLIDVEPDSDYSFILDQFGEPIKRSRERVNFGFVR